MCLSPSGGVSAQHISLSVLFCEPSAFMCDCHRQGGSVMEGVYLFFRRGIFFKLFRKWWTLVLIYTNVFSMFLWSTLKVKGLWSWIKLSCYVMLYYSAGLIQIPTQVLIWTQPILFLQKAIIQSCIFHQMVEFMPFISDQRGGFGVEMGFLTPPTLILLASFTTKPSTSCQIYRLLSESWLVAAFAPVVPLRCTTLPPLQEL